MKFNEVIGQEEAKERLMKMVREDRVPHAMMLCGPTGSGKMALALALASYLLGERDEEPLSAQTRNAEAMLKKWQHPDLHFTYPVIRPANKSADHKMVSDDFTKEWHELLMDGPYFTMDQWLDQMKAANQQAIIGAGESDDLTRKLSLKSSQGGYKISLIWLPERMNQECANKLLKLLEEPPALTLFIMVCEEPEHLIETIRSRTQRIDIKRIDEKDIQQALIQRRGIEEETAHRIARLSNGSWLRAMDTLDADNENSQFLNMFIVLMRMAYTRNVKELKKWSETVAGYGRERQKRMLTYFMQMIRENFMYNFHQAELNYMTQEEENFTRNFARFINEANVIEINDLLALARRDIGQNANGKIVFFDLALKMVVLLIKK
ncbi:MAG: ATP-binding protein [Prevotella sp.]|nr:ATP-binding protein [Prevotella sp.]